TGRIHLPWYESAPIRYATSISVRCVKGGCLAFMTAAGSATCGFASSAPAVLTWCAAIMASTGSCASEKLPSRELNCLLISKQRLLMRQDRIAGRKLSDLFQQPPAVVGSIFLQCQQCKSPNRLAETVIAQHGTEQVERTLVLNRGQHFDGAQRRLGIAVAVTKNELPDRLHGLLILGKTQLPKNFLAQCARQ